MVSPQPILRMSVCQAGLSLPVFASFQPRFAFHVFKEFDGIGKDSLRQDCRFQNK